MPDDRSRPGGQDRARFSLSEERLRAAVEMVGEQAEDLQPELRGG